MSKQNLDFLPPNEGAIVVAIAEEGRRTDTPRNVKVKHPDGSALLAAADRDHLERELAAIERAAAALRRADPKLEKWDDVPAPAMHKPRPVWLLIGVLWLSTALMTVGAAVAISALVG